MIKMIKGTYGRKVNGTVEAMTPRSEPFSLSKDREAELIKAGVAVEVKEPEPKDYNAMKMAELRKEAATLKVDASAAKNKKELIDLLEKAKAGKTAQSEG